MLCSRNKKVLLPPRTNLINRHLSLLNKSTYLEIGVRCGANLFQINASRKIGVDPDYFFSKRSLIKALFQKRNWFLKMFKMESDIFFSNKGASLFRKSGIDLVFIDGMHTYRQSLKDATNSLSYLNKGGIIIFHDCNPTSKIAAQPSIPSQKINWNGDVWKTIYHFRQFPEYFECYTYNSDQGLGVLKMRNNIATDTTPKLQFRQDFQDLAYEYLSRNRVSTIGLKEFPN